MIEKLAPKNTIEESRFSFWRSFSIQKWVLHSAFAFFLTLPLALPFTVAAAPSCQAILDESWNLQRIRESQLPSGYISKYNSRFIEVVYPDFSVLERIRRSYHDLPVPELVRKLAKGEEENFQIVSREAPSLIQWNSLRDTMLIINPPYRGVNEYIDHYQSGTLQQMKNLPTGLAFVTWLIPPEVASAPENIRIRDIKKVSGYKATILDLQSADIPYLKELKSMALTYLSENFGITPQDDVKLFFHAPVSPRFAALHLHIRVNQAFHGSDLAKSFSIDDIISTLESGRSVYDLILERARRNRGLVVNDGTFLRGNGIVLFQVTSPYYDPSFGQP